MKKRLKYTVKDMQLLALSRGGQCLSDEYMGAMQKIRWQCSEGHQWSATPNNIRNGKWCPFCARTKKLSIETIYELALSKGGKCLSKKYINAKVKLHWQCSEGHKWYAPQSDVKQGQWCPICAGKVVYSINDAKKVANERNGYCLSQNYENSKIPLHWQCADGHKWKASFSSIKRGSWCPYCKMWFHQEICRAIFEHLFGVKFPIDKPNWLLNEDGNLMHLDGYNKSMKIAFEYQGEQHNKKGFFTRTEKELTKRMNDDVRKAELCYLNGVRLFQIPHELKVKEFTQFILNKAEDYGIKIPKQRLKTPVNFNNIYHHNSQLNILQQIAKDRGGNLVSDIYYGDGEHLFWECAKGHKWKATPSNVKKGTWCPKCGGRSKLTINDMREIAAQKGGKCISNKYINNRSNLIWECAKGHRWEATPTNIKSGKWCASCANRPKITIHDMHELANNFGGKCLSSSYTNNRTKLEWMCINGHKFFQTPEKIKSRGYWCKECK